VSINSKMDCNWGSGSPLRSLMTCFSSAAAAARAATPRTPPCAKNLASSEALSAFPDLHSAMTVWRRYGVVCRLAWSERRNHPPSRIRVRISSLTGSERKALMRVSRTRSGCFFNASSRSTAPFSNSTINFGRFFLDIATCERQATYVSNRKSLGPKSDDQYEVVVRNRGGESCRGQNQ
jgi:hypothetical protein